MSYIEDKINEDKSGVVSAGSQEAMKVIKNGLLAVMATIATTILGVLFASHFGIVISGWVGALIFLAVMVGMIFLISAAANTPFGLPLLLTFGFLQGIFLMGFITQFTVTSLLIATGTTLGITAACMFLALSGKVDSSKWGPYLLIVLVAAIIGIVINIFLASTMLSLMLSMAIIFIMGGLIVYETQQAVNNPHDSYIHFALGLYLSMINIFIHTLNILGIMDE
ncbi:hypothetical protein PBI_SCTP2_332 [Salicola phage SCTP-2]|nr:hypothetical protein PBI_SCTP2_332 [Salicola phage SCTP-2]